MAVSFFSSCGPIFGPKDLPPWLKRVHAISGLFGPDVSSSQKQEAKFY